jgi:hypothetical protein
MDETTFLKLRRQRFSFLAIATARGGFGARGIDRWAAKREPQQDDSYRSIG